MNELQNQIYMLEHSIKESLGIISSFSKEIPTSKALLQIYQTYQMLNVYEKNPKANSQYFKQFQILFQKLCSQRIVTQQNLQINDYETKILNEIQRKYKVGENDLIGLKTKTTSQNPPDFISQQPTISLKMQDQKKQTQHSIESDQSTAKSQENNYSLTQFEIQIKKAYQEHKIDRAYSLGQQYRKIHISESSSEFINLLDTIKFQYTKMDGFYQQLHTDQWIFDKAQDGISLHYKVYEPEKLIAIRIDSQFQIPIDQFMAIVTEIDLMEKYIPFAEQTRERKNINRNQKIGQSKIFMPLLSNRQVYFYAAGYDRIATKGSVIFYSKTIDTDKEFQQKYDYPVPQKSQLIRLQYKYFVLEYIPVSPTRGKVRLVSNVDLKLSFLPMWILCKSARVFSFNYFKNIQKASQNFSGSPWQKKVLEKPDVYEFFKKKIQDYFDS